MKPLTGGARTTYRQGMETTSVPLTFGPSFRRVREKHDISVRAVSRQSGIPHPTISRWERGQRDISGDARARLVKALRDLRGANSLPDA